MLTDQLKTTLKARGKDYAPDDANRHRQGALMAEVFMLLLEHCPDRGTAIERKAMVRVQALVAEKFARGIEAMWNGQWKEDTSVDEAGYQVVGAALMAGLSVEEFLFGPKEKSDTFSLSDPSEKQQHSSDEPRIFPPAKAHLGANGPCCGNLYGNRKIEPEPLYPNSLDYDYDFSANPARALFGGRSILPGAEFRVEIKFTDGPGDILQKRIAAQLKKDHPNVNSAAANEETAVPTTDHDCKGCC